MRPILFFCLLCTLVSCSVSRNPYSDELFSLKRSYVKEVQKKYHFEFTGEGSQALTIIKKLFLDFNSYQEMDIAEVRKMYVPLVEGFLAKINQNEVIRPYLDHYPFTEKGVDIAIYFFQPNRDPVQNGKVARVNMLNGVVRYYKYNTNANMYLLMESEPFSQAKQMVQ